MQVYNSITAFQTVRMRGTLQQTNNGLLYRPPSGGVGNTTTSLIEGLAVGYASLQNRSGSTAVVGLAGRLPNRLWIAGQYTAGAFVDDTTDAQDSGASDFALESTTNDSGFIIASPVKFAALSLNVGTASAGGSAVRAISYTNSAGDGWTTPSTANLFIHDGASGNYSTGEQLIVWAPWTDWGTTQAGGFESVPAGLYAIRIQATTAPSGTAGSATAIEVFTVGEGAEGITDNTEWTFNPTHGEMRFPYADGLAAIFGTASSGNRASVNVRTA